MKVGDPFDTSSEMGPLAMERQRDRVESYIAKGRAEGARLATGGGRPAHLERGYYVEPTVFAGVDNRSTIAREEIFGPVLSVIPADSEEQAILEDIAEWNGRFGDAIFASRPWRIAGEGPTHVASGQFGEGAAKPFTAQDIRFTTKDSDLHAMTLGPVSGRISVASLATETNLGRGEVERVEVVGSNAPLDFSRDRQGLHVEVPEGASHPFGIALRLRGRGWPGAAPGDQIVTLEVRTPKAETEQQKALYRQMSEEFDFDPRA